jgi:heme exporter protein B
MRDFLSASWAIYAKDMRLEARTKETITGALVFAVIVAFIFGFAFDPSPRIISVVGPGIVWVAFAFTGVLSMNRSFANERDRGTLEGLMLAPLPREALYAGKLAATLTIMLAVELVMLPIFLVLFDLSLFNVWFALTALVATVGFAASGTLFAAMAAHTRAREVLLPLLFLPISLPVIIAAVSGSAASLDGDGWDGVGMWLQFMMAFDMVFLVLSSWAFQYVLEE